jgi:predicted DNA-binding protein
MDKLKDKKMVSIRMDNELLKKVYELSKKENRTISGLIRWIIIKFIGNKK